MAEATTPTRTRKAKPSAAPKTTDAPVKAKPKAKPDIPMIKLLPEFGSIEVPDVLAMRASGMKWPDIEAAIAAMTDHQYHGHKIIQLGYRIEATKDAKKRITEPLDGPTVVKLRDEGVRWDRIRIFAEAGGQKIGEAAIRSLWEAETGNDSSTHYCGRGRRFAPTAKYAGMVEVLPKNYKQTHEYDAKAGKWVPKEGVKVKPTRRRKAKSQAEADAGQVVENSEGTEVEAEAPAPAPKPVRRKRTAAK